MSAKDLWSAVVLQAVSDIETEHYSSVEYAQAVSFFLAPGDWAESRQRIADCIGLHPDDLMRGGRRAIAARHRRDGGPPVVVRPVALPQSRPTRPEPLPTPVVPVVTAPRLKPPPPRPPVKRQPRTQHDRDWWVERFLAKQRVA